MDVPWICFAQALVYTDKLHKEMLSGNLASAALKTMKAQQPDPLPT